MFSGMCGRAGRVLVAAASMFAMLLLLDAGPLRAQQGAVTGQVVDASNLQPVSGAQVFFPNLDLGTLTNEEGRYRITGVPAGTHRLRVRLLGYRASVRQVEVSAGETVTANFQLNVSAVSLGEIVVTQTGEQRSRELGRNISTIDAADQVQKSRSGTIQDLIKGRATGTTIRSASGSVGTSQNFNIRGNTTLTLGNTPEIYIDGVRVNNDNAGVDFFGGQQTSRLNDLNPEDIESIQVLKGPSATTLYGADAAQGVLVIETKRGRSGDTRWTGRVEGGGNWDSTDWIGVTWSPVQGPVLTVPGLGIPAVGDSVHIMNLLEGNGAGIDAPFRTGAERNFAGSARGGFAEGNVTYYISGEYEQDKGNLDANMVTKWSTRANFNISPSEKVDVSVSNGFTNNNTRLPQNDNNSFGIVAQGLLGLPLFNPVDRMDPFNPDNGMVRTCPLAFEAAKGLNALGIPPDLPSLGPAGFCGQAEFGLTFDQAALTTGGDDVQRYTGSGTITYRPVDFLTSRVTVGFDETDNLFDSFTPNVPNLQGFSDSFEGFILKQNSRQTELTIQGTSTADFALTDDFTSSTTAGVQWLDSQNEGINVQCQTFPAGSPACDNAVQFQQTGTNDFFVEERTLGLFWEEQIGWRDRMFLTGGGRLDDNSSTGADLSAKFFPQISYSWVMSEEEFFPGFFDQFKLRVAWGQSGKLPGTNDALALAAANPSPFRGEDVLSVTPGQPGNPDLEPARVSEWEVGADLSILDGRLGGEFTWYRQTTEDDIVSRPLAPSTGFPFNQNANVGKLRNNGVETALNATAFNLPDLTWDLRAQVSTNFNEILQLDNPIDLGFNQRHAQGRPFGAYFSRAAFLNDAGEVEVTPGSVFELEGTPIDETDPTPNVNGSLSSTVTLFNHVTLYGLAELATGHQIFDDNLEFACDFALTKCANVFEVGPDGQLTDRARLQRAAAPADAELNFVEDADYVKLRTVSLRFDLPNSWTQFFNGRDVSLQVTGENLAMWTGATSDPEATVGGSTQAFFSNFLTLPPAKRVTASMQVSF